MTRKEANATSTEPLLKKGVAVAMKLQEMEEHVYACAILPDAAKFLRKMEELGVLPEDYYMSGLLEWLDDQCSGFTYEEYEKFETAKRNVDWKGYLLWRWSGEKHGGISAFIRIAKWKLEQYEFFRNKFFDAIGNIDANNPETIAANILDILSMFYALRALYGLDTQMCGEYIEQHADATLKDIPRIRLIQKFMSRYKEKNG